MIFIVDLSRDLNRFK